MSVSRPMVAVASSGGLDSTALLHCTIAQARTLGVGVVALHVHHGLMPEADAWLSKVRRQALRWGAGFLSTRLQGAPSPGDSVEAWARDMRYAALADMARSAGCDRVLLAHHRRDQAETWMLQALRGAGEAGLSAMPRQAFRQGVHWIRPWIEMRREAIQAYAERHRLRWVQDPSNADPRYSRSRLRHAVWPVLESAFAQAEVSLALAARHAQSSAALAQEVAQHDLATLSDEQGLRLPLWLDLGPARQRNALRAWLQGLPGLGGHFPPYTLVDRLMAELPRARGGRWPAPGGELHLYRGRLCYASAVHADGFFPLEQWLDLSHPGRVPLPAWGGEIVVSHCVERGVDPTLLRSVRVHARTGGERFALAPGAMPRSLKKQYQDVACPAWARGGPLVSAASGALLFVPVLGIDARAWALPDQPQLQLSWASAAKPGTASGPVAG